MYEVEGHLSGREGLGWGAHEGVYEVVGLLSGREGSSQGRMPFPHRLWSSPSTDRALRKRSRAGEKLVWVV